jgi:hypothetical protein
VESKFLSSISQGSSFSERPFLVRLKARMARKMTRTRIATMEKSLKKESSWIVKPKRRNLNNKKKISNNGYLMAQLRNELLAYIYIHLSK